MVHHFLANLVESCILGKVWNVSVHLAIHLDIFHHLGAVGFQSAVEVVKILYTAYLPRRSIEEFRWNSLRQWVVTLLLIPRHEVVAVFGNHAVELWNLVGRVLQVGIHCYHHAPSGSIESAVERRTLAVVAAELNATHLVGAATEFLNNVPRAVGGAVVDEDNLEGVAL